MTVRNRRLMNGRQLAFLVIGAAITCAGLAMVYLPLAVVVAGLLVAALGVEVAER